MSDNNALVIFFPGRAVPGTVEEIPGGLRDFTRLPFPTPGKIWHLSRVARPRFEFRGSTRNYMSRRRKAAHSIIGKDFRANHLTQGFQDGRFKCEVCEHFLFVSIYSYRGFIK